MCTYCKYCKYVNIQIYYSDFFIKRLYCPKFCFSTSKKIVAHKLPFTLSVQLEKIYKNVDVGEEK